MGWESFYHATGGDMIKVRWRDEADNFDWLLFPTPGAKILTEAANHTNSQEANLPGGSFAINKFDQVISIRRSRNAHNL
jgi:hypothetical protein